MPFVGLDARVIAIDVVGGDELCVAVGFDPFARSAEDDGRGLDFGAGGSRVEEELIAGFL